MDAETNVARAIAAARVGSHAEVLASLLAAWREVRAPELATLIEAASRIAARDRAPITGRSQRALHAAWVDIDAARDPADVDRLVATLGHGNLTQANERIGRLALRPPDPRVAAGLEALIASPPSVAFVKGTSTPLWDAVCAELARIADPRTRTIHERLAWLAHDRAASPFDAGTKRARNTKAIAKVAQAIPPAPELSPALRARCDELAAVLRAVPAPADRGAELLAKIHDDPHDLATRAVYADWLTSNGDPRGEFIALQLARAETPIPLPAVGWREREPSISARERALHRTHQSVWTGRLGPLLEHALFERGFPARGRLAPSVTLRALAIPEAATLSHLGVNTDDEADGQLLAHRPFHGLVFVAGLGWNAFAGLAMGTASGARVYTRPAIRALEISDDDALPRGFEFLETDWPLEQLALRTGRQDSPRPADAEVLQFMRTRLVRQLKTLWVGYQARNDRAFVRGFVESEIRLLELDTWSYAFDLFVERDDAGAPRTRIAVRYDSHPSNRASTVPLLRERAATWPRELVDSLVVELDERYAKLAPDEHANILAAMAAFAGDVEVIGLSSVP